MNTIKPMLSLDHLMFRKFVSNNMKEIDSIYDQARLEYDKIYQQLFTRTDKHRYTYNDHVIYYILFEEITMETHTTFCHKSN
ncbi:hypothetical protein KHA80_12595 [Anaerobacillus sp. HL2]|nr:hypothetical protein KHA80_12595 [Anaerobacillus sp. HL2]